MTAVVLTISDSSFAGTRDDLSGPVVADALRVAGFEVAQIQVVADEHDAIVTALRQAVEQAQLVVTTGGTGLAARDVTPEATVEVCERLVPGIAERMRMEGLAQTPRSVLSRGVCGTVPSRFGQSMVLNLPGSPKGAVFSLQAVLGVLPHALDVLRGQTDHS